MVDAYSFVIGIGIGMLLALCISILARGSA